MSEQAENEDAPPPLPAVDGWLVDGYNALHAVLLGGESRDGWWSSAQRQRLLERLRHFGRLADGSHVIVVFDGSTPASEELSAAAAPIQIEFAPSADDWIVRRVKRERKQREASSVGVVTQDRRLVNRCRSAGARVVSPAVFLAHCPQPEAAPMPPDSGEARREDPL